MIFANSHRRGFEGTLRKDARHATPFDQFDHDEVVALRLLDSGTRRADAHTTNVLEFPDRRKIDRHQTVRPWQCLYFLPDPHGQASLRPTFRSCRTNVSAFCPVAAAWGSLSPLAPFASWCMNCIFFACSSRRRRSVSSTDSGRSIW